MNTVFPPRCPVSDEPVTHHGTFAPSVWRALAPMAPPWCSACGLPFAYENKAVPLCGACAAPDKFKDSLTGPGRLDQVRAALHYDETIATAILRLKYADRFDGVAAFAPLMAQAGQELFTRNTVLVPIPLHRRRLWARKYNQAGALATAVARVAGVEVQHQSLSRARATPSQRGGSRSARMRNVSGAFKVPEATVVEGRDIVLVDDVLTTGATLIAAARPLRRAGARSVKALVLTRVVKGAEPSLYEGEVEEPNSP